MAKAKAEFDLKHAISEHSQRLEEHYHWLETNMQGSFLKDMSSRHVMLVAHHLVGFELQQHFSKIDLKDSAIVLCLDSPEADLRILREYENYGVRNYRTYVSTSAISAGRPLRIALLQFSELRLGHEKAIPEEKFDALLELWKERNAELGAADFKDLIRQMNPRFLRSVGRTRLVLALDMFLRAKTRDHCQYEIRRNKDWQEKGLPSMQIVLAWRNVPKHNFLYRLARVVHRHKLVVKGVNATYVDNNSMHSILVMVLDLHGEDDKAAWEVADLSDFLKELVTLKFFGGQDLFETTFVDTGLLRGNIVNLLRTMMNFIHQVLVHKDKNLYNLANIQEALCRHPELTCSILESFETKFNPASHNIEKYKTLRQQIQARIDQLDTGQEENDRRRKDVLSQAVNFVDHVLKTNVYRNNKVALSFRMDPHYLDHVPFDRSEKFPELPFAVYFVKGMHFLGFHIRFRDLARGGLRTVIPQKIENVLAEQPNVFAECYNLAYTQQKKNKDIPEGGAKAIIFIRMQHQIAAEAAILAKELALENLNAEEIEKRTAKFAEEQRLEILYEDQRCFVDSLMTLINGDDSGTLVCKDIVDYYNKPEYIYLGPDENMHNSMIQWIADYSIRRGYRIGGAFISSKPNLGINHKQYGVTSLGCSVYMREALIASGINPDKDKFSIKISGGPDGDVAGNMIGFLYRDYPKTAVLKAITDVSGTIFDPNGLDLPTLFGLFEKALPISNYPPEKLGPGAFLLDRGRQRDESSYTKTTLCWRRNGKELVQDWLSGSDMNKLYRSNVHKTKTDVFVPGGGRPRTLNAQNIADFLDDEGRPTSQIIVEGANLYLTAEARTALEDKGVMIVKDSSANKCGVICSSYEILCGLTLTTEQWLENRDVLISEILEILKTAAFQEARLLIEHRKATGESMIKASEKVSKRILEFKDQLLTYLTHTKLSTKASDPLNQVYLAHCPPTLRKKFEQQLLSKVPDLHKKAVIASRLSAQLVYKRGLQWQPSLVDVLPTLLEAHIA